MRNVAVFLSLLVLLRLTLWGGYSAPSMNTNSCRGADDHTVGTKLRQLCSSLDASLRLLPAANPQRPIIPSSASLVQLISAQSNCFLKWLDPFFVSSSNWSWCRSSFTSCSRDASDR